MVYPLSVKQEMTFQSQCKLNENYFLKEIHTKEHRIKANNNNVEYNNNKCIYIFV